uniref:Uncharacterized protein n=1 Tax=Knipowitschia caucasica TaxID=637954 RepID=A0AAV2JKG2_KNICA
MDHFSEISVSTEASLQIVRSHFEQIGGLQWVMLSKGMCDLETRRILTAMFISLVQTLSANVLGLIVPRSEVNHKFLSESESTRAHGSIVTVLQDTMGQVFSQALNLSTDSLDKHQDSQELTTLIEQEVEKGMSKIIVAIVKDLKSQYGTAQRMLESALDGKDRTFDETVLKSLQYHFEHNLRNKSFLSRVSRGLCKLVQCCCCPNIEEITPSEHPNASYKTPNASY